MKQFMSGIVGVMCLALVVAAAAAEPAKVKIDSGTLVGTAEGGVNVFKGVPFATPPVGKLRWRAPMKPAGWSGERDATKFSLPCPQPTTPDGKVNGGGVTGAWDEDCLYLNVWAPANAKNAPVMLWLYGGAGFLGAGHLGSFNGTAFAHDGVIVVTINYRLGALGYFSHPALTKVAKPDEPLNSYALLDAIEGLKWVQRNITAFGGDPKNVTLFGQSAGGAMVLNLLATSNAKGLFHKAVVESGASLRPGTPLATAEENGAKAATALGLPGANATAEQLRSVPAKTFVDTDSVKRGMGGVIDGRLMTTSAEESLTSGKAIDVPLIIGTNNGEGGAESARKVAGLMAAGAPSYLYQFAYVPQWRKAEQPKGAPHSAEIVYVFDSWNSSVFGGPMVNATDRKVSARVHSCWVAFAKAPVTTKSLSCADGFTWPAYTKENDSIVVFGETPRVSKGASIPPFVPSPPPSPPST